MNSTFLSRKKKLRPHCKVIDIEVVGQQLVNQHRVRRGFCNGVKLNLNGFFALFAVNGHAGHAAFCLKKTFNSFAELHVLARL